MKKTVIRDFLFADDCALNANTEETMQHETDCLCQGCDNLVITISTKNTAEVIYQPILTVKGQNPQAVVPNFIYLGSAPSREVYLDAEFSNRIAKASVAF